jgi:hypothetical protein
MGAPAACPRPALAAREEPPELAIPDGRVPGRAEEQGPPLRKPSRRSRVAKPKTIVIESHHTVGMAIDPIRSPLE